MICVAKKHYAFLRMICHTTTGSAEGVSNEYFRFYCLVVCVSFVDEDGEIFVV